MVRKFDLVAIGSGSAASATAKRCRAAGWQVAVVDCRPFGGTCALRGCDPKKVLVGASEALDLVHRFTGRGIRTEKLEIDWPELMRFKRSFTDPVPRGVEERFAAAGVTMFHGNARFLAPAMIEVGGEALEAGFVVIATGQRPVDLRIPGGRYLTTSEQFLELDQLPKRIVFVGGGYIAFEFAHVAARAGSQVTILHRGARPLEQFDADLVDELVKATRELGVAVQLETQVNKVEAGPGHLIVSAEVDQQNPEAGQSSRFETDMVIHAACREPDLDDLDLAMASVERSARGVTVNEFLQSVSNPAIYAAGDAAASGGAPLTPVASYDGALVAANLLEGNHRKADYTGVPTVVFTTPPMASVGISEVDANKAGLRFRVKKEMTAGWYSSRRVAERHSGFKVLIEEHTDRILGAHLLGGQADEVINFFALAMRTGITATQLKHAIFSYPTRSSNLPYML